MAGDVSSSREATTISQINVTPLVDVMLVLLVIFMVTAPIIQQGVQVNLPQTQSSAIPGTEEHLVVTVAKNGKIYLNDNAMSLAELGEKRRSLIDFALVTIRRAPPATGTSTSSSGSSLLLGTVT